MGQDRYHVTLGTRHTTVSLDPASSNMLALKLGHEPRTDAARAAIRDYLQKKLDEYSDPHRTRVSQWLREWILLDLVDKKLAHARPSVIVDPRKCPRRVESVERTASWTMAPEATMDFPITELMDEDACYQFLVQILHPDGLACPRCQTRDGLKVHKRLRAPILDYRCAACGRVFNAFTNTVFHKTSYHPSELVLFLRGIAQGVPTAQLARELRRNRSHLLERRHQLQEQARQAADPLPLDDPVVEADEMYQNAEEKGVPHPDPLDPPRRRANPQPGHGTWASDRPPVAAVVGRQSGQVRLRVVEHADQKTLQEFVRRMTWPGTLVNSDEWSGYARLPELGRGHATVCHSQGEWARDDDGDGIREVHDNTLEGLWTGLRNFLRQFRGVSKHYLRQYVALFQWAHNLKRVTVEFLRSLLWGRRLTVGQT